MSSEPVPSAIPATRSLRPATPLHPATTPRPGTALAVGVGAGLGGAARYAVMPDGPVGGGFPWATLGVNVTGALVLAVVATLVAERWPPTRYVRPFVGVGICGGYTTWSAFMTDAALLGREGRVALAAVYLVASVAAGLAATVGGIRLARGRAGRRQGGAGPARGDRPESPA